MTENLLEFNNVCYSFHTKNGEIEALRDITFSIAENQFVAVVGPSGCGKTTVLSLISGILEKSCGEITKKEGLTCGYMLQRDCLFPWRTVLKNTTLGLEICKSLDDRSINYVKSLLEKYDLKEFIDKYPSSLSGGMRQRVALIRTLALKPDLLLLDEPTSALDYQTRLEVSNDLFKIIKGEKKSAILVTHDISEAISMADKIIVLSNRPAKIKGTFTVDFPKDLTPLKRRESPNFHIYFEKIWKEFERDES